MSYNHLFLLDDLSVLVNILKLLFTSETMASGGCLKISTFSYLYFGE